MSRDSEVGEQQPPKAMGMPCAMVTPEVLQHGGRSRSLWDRAGASPRGFLQPSTLLGGAGRLFSGWPGFTQSLSGKRWNRMFREGNKTCVPRGLRQRSVPRQERDLCCRWRTNQCYTKGQVGGAWERGQEGKGLSGGQELGYKPGAPQDPEQRPCRVSLHPEPCVAAGPGPGTGLPRAAGTAPTLHSSQPSQAGAPPAVPFPLSPDPASPLKAI